MRILFWSRFLAAHQIESTQIEASLYAQAYILADQIEYHLLGNHYLENGFGLLFAAYQFEDQYLYRKAYDIIYEELQEQILPDGGHFERSPMYHQIILYRVLDCLNLASNNPDFGKPDFRTFLANKATVMMGWLQEITFSNGDIPLLNDSARGIAPDTLALQDYAKRLGVAIHHTPLQESGYRKFTIPPFELVADAGVATAPSAVAHTGRRRICLGARETGSSMESMVWLRSGSIIANMGLFSDRISSILS